MKKGLLWIALILFAFVFMFACSEKPKETQSDREIIEAIFDEWYPSLKNDEVVLWANEAMGAATALSGTHFGSIISGEDAMEKAQVVWMELGWLNDMKEDKANYMAQFYDEYGVWMVDSYAPPHGVDSQGRRIPPPPGSGYCAIMRETDGVVLAAWLS